MTDIVKLLKATRKRIAKKKSWIQGEFASIHGKSAKVNCWCLDGALRADSEKYGGLGSPVYDGAIRALLRAIRSRSYRSTFGVWAYNDRAGRTQAQVVAAVDRAIAIAEKKGDTLLCS